MKGGLGHKKQTEPQAKTERLIQYHKMIKEKKPEGFRGIGNLANNNNESFESDNYGNNFKLDFYFDAYAKKVPYYVNINIGDKTAYYKDEKGFYYFEVGNRFNPQDIYHGSLFSPKSKQYVTTELPNDDTKLSNDDTELSNKTGGKRRTRRRSQRSNKKRTNKRKKNKTKMNRRKTSNRKTNKRRRKR